MSASSNALTRVALADHASLLALGRSLVGSEGSDVVQDALLKAMVERRPVLNPVAWVRRVIRNEAHSRRRASLRRRAREEAVGGSPDSSSLEVVLARSQILDALQVAWSELGSPYEEALRLRFEEGLSAREIGIRQGCPTNTASWRVREGICRLRKRLDRQFGDRRHWFGALAVATELPSDVTTAAEPTKTMKFTPSIALATLATLAATAAGASALQTSDPSPREASSGATAANSGSSSAMQASPSDAGAVAVPTSDAAVEPRPVSAMPAALPLELELEYGVELETYGKGMSACGDAISELATVARDVYPGCREASGYDAKARFELAVPFSMVDGVSERALRQPSDQGLGTDALASCLRDSLFSEVDREYTPGFEGTLTFRFRPLEPGEFGVEAAVDRMLREEPVDIDVSGLPMQGIDAKADAPVTLLECVDLECPYTQKVGPTVDRVLDEYEGKIRYVVSQNPMTFHEGAQLKAQALVAAQLQGQYWGVSDYLSMNPTPMSKAELHAMAESLGLDVARFESDLRSAATVAEVERQRRLCVDNRAKGTPTFFVNGRKLAGAREFEVFEGAIDAVLQSAGK